MSNQETIGTQKLYQVWATETKTGQLVAVPFFPRVMQEAALKFVQDMNSQIRKGREKRYADPVAMLHLG